ncbi:hypothetical protein [Streptomyces sp. NPDC047981]|uniref:hypothetical protein n=1 Tax=Streptomyces sp. NPDC047981 TaxID=3154610 RepID=UPI003444922D
MTTPETRARLGALKQQLAASTPKPLEGQTAIPLHTEPVRYDCPFCGWYTNPPEGTIHHSAYQQIGGHILGVHGREPVLLTHGLVQRLPNSAPTGPTEKSAP